MPLYAGTEQIVKMPKEMNGKHGNYDPPVVFLSLEANIGAGKTTQFELLKLALEDREDVIFLDEPVGEWEERGLLGDFYEGRIGHGSFQLMVLMSLAGPLIRAVQKRPRIIVAERSPQSNFHTFAKVNLRGSDYTAYEYTYNKLLEAIPKGAIELHMLYLALPPEKAMERIKQRSRSSEGTVSADYLRMLHDAHELMEKYEVADQFTRLDAMLPPEEVHAQLLEYAKAFLTLDNYAVI